MTTTDYINKIENTFTKYVNCEYCNNLTDCRLIKRLYQDPEFLKRHGEPYICNMCLSSMKKRGEIGTHSLYHRVNGEIYHVSYLTSLFKITPWFV
jgi:hypothetical protein